MSETGDDRLSDPSQSGSTLIEALVVVTIITTVSLIGFPRLQQSLLVLGQRQTAAMAAARLREARAEALREDATVTFAIAPDGRTFGTARGGVFTAPQGVTVIAAAGTGGGVAFYGDGSSSGGRILVMAAARRLAVDIAASGGAVRLEPG